MRWRGPRNGADKSFRKSWVSGLLLFTGINDVDPDLRGITFGEDICSSRDSRFICGSTSDCDRTCIMLGIVSLKSSVVMSHE